MDSFIDLFQLREDSGKDYVNHHTSLNDGLKILKGTADLMKEIEVQTSTWSNGTEMPIRTGSWVYETNQRLFPNATLFICQDQVNFR